MRLVPRSQRWRRVAIVGGVLLALLLIAGVSALLYVRRDEPEVHAQDEANFKYGSIGSEAGGGIPYWIWRVLPTVFPQHLPPGQGEGYERMGFIYEAPGRDRPIGTSLREKPIPLVGLNCGSCHTTTVRDSPSSRARIVLGAPAHRFDIEEYFQFLFDCARDERFTADVLLDAIDDAGGDLSTIDRLFYRYVVIPRMKDALNEREEELSLLEERPDFGPGRVDTFFSYKIHFDLPVAVDDPVGTVDFPTLWNQGPRRGMWLHWDGNNDSVEERNLSAALGAGSTESSVDHDNLKRITDWIATLPAPRMPNDKIDGTLTATGQRVYQAQCASCHDFSGDRVGEVAKLDEIGTDHDRVRSFTPELVAKLNTFGAGYPWRFTRFRKTNGYANMPLDGVWLRAPYLHNGSVPTLRDLLSPPEQRPDVFYRGYNVYDYENVGFVSDGPAARREGFRFDTSVRGNGNEGHTYGTTLPPRQKAALLEYLKTK